MRRAVFFIASGAAALAALAASCDRSGPEQEPAPEDRHSELTAKASAAQLWARESIAVWSRHLASDPQSFTAWSKLGQSQFSLARSTADEKLYADAEASLQRSEEISPQASAQTRAALPAVRIARRRLAGFRRLAETVALARRTVEALAPQPPFQSLLLALQGDLALAAGDYERAKAIFDRQARESPGVLAWERQARLASLMGRRDVAETLLLQARGAARGPALAAEVEAALGGHYLEEGRIVEARLCLEKALRLRPGFFPALRHMSRACELGGDRQRARSCLEEALQSQRSPGILWRLGGLAETPVEAELLRGEALAELELRMTRDDPAAMAETAEALLEQPQRLEDLERALELARAVHWLRDDIGADLLLARACRLAGLLDEARSQVERSLRLGTRDADLYLEAAAVHEALARQHRADAERYRYLAKTCNPLALR